MAQQALTILNDLVFAELFAAGSRAEVPIVGRIACDGGVPIEVSGQVDRLAVTGDSVLIADYKTDRAVPAQLGRGAASLHRPAGAIPRGAGAHLPGENDSRRIDLYRRAERHRGARPGHGGRFGRNRMRKNQPKPCAPLTLR